MSTRFCGGYRLLEPDTHQPRDRAYNEHQRRVS
jgi:hypothetical protein